MEKIGYGASVTITRPNDTTAYTAGDVVGGALELKPIGGYGHELMIMSARLLFSDAAVISGMANFRLHFYNVTPPSALADNAPWDLASTDRDAYRGYVDVGTPVDLGSSLYVQADALYHQLKLDSQSLFAYLQTIGAYTPAAQSTIRSAVRGVIL